MVEVATAISLASSAYAGIKKAMEMGKEAQDVAEFFGRWFEAKEQIAEVQQYANNPSMMAKMFSSKSVEAQALQVTSARYKIQAMEKELREYLIYTGQVDFYEDMMKERRVIRQARLLAAKRKAEKRAFILNTIAVLLGMSIASFLIVGIFVALI
tara:strand:+ start:309 stop:773 length:465 start_codon:yes stop_codon:yes gene_type:complete